MSRTRRNFFAKFKYPGIGKRLPTGHDRVHDLIDIVELPPLRLIKGMSQRLLEQLF